MNPEIRTPQIAGIAGPLKSLSEALLPEIRDKTYGLLVCEGTSARIPTFILWKVITELSGEMVPVVYPSTGYLEGSELAGLPSSEQLAEAGKKVLLCTEIIHSGEHVRLAGIVLSSLGLKYDVGAMFASYSEEDYRRLRMFSGGVGYYFGYQFPELFVERLSYFDRTPRCSVYKQDWLNLDMWDDLRKEDSDGGCIPEKVMQVREDLKVLTEWITESVTKSLSAAR